MLKQKSIRRNKIAKLCGNRDKTINLTIREYNKLAQKEYKTRYDWVGIVIHWELRNELKFTTQNFS